MTTNTGNDSFNAIRFTAQKHKLNSPFNKAAVTANTAPGNQATTSAAVDPLPWAAASLHSFYTDYSEAAPSQPLSLPAGALLFHYDFVGQVTTAGAGSVSLGFASTPGGAIVLPINTVPVGAGNVAFNVSSATSVGPLPTVMYPVFSFDVDVTAVTVAPSATLQYLQM